MALKSRGHVRSRDKLKTSTTALMVDKRRRVLTYNEDLLSMTSYDLSVMCSFQFTWYIKCYIFNSIRSMGTKYGKTVAYHEGLPPIKSLDYLNKWSCEVTWQIKTFTLPEDMNMLFITMLSGDLPWKAFTHKVTWPFDHLKKLYLLATKLGRVVISGRRFRTQTLSRHRILVSFALWFYFT